MLSLVYSNSLSNTTQRKLYLTPLIIPNNEKHIVTIEDPIEYVHTNKAGMVRQREVGKDTQSFYTGLRAALRQDPDVIAIGEMRDYETIKITLAVSQKKIIIQPCTLMILPRDNLGILGIFFRCNVRFINSHTIYELRG